MGVTGAQKAEPAPFRLTSLAHGGGCGCKLSPAVLRDLLAGQPAMQAFPDLLVGTETGDDAAAYRINDDTCVIATTDFFMPVVDDPTDFGRIAATNAISDVYAMGGRPIMALAVLGMPVDKIAPEMVRAILAGGASVCADAGIPVAGGHSIDAPEPIYGLAVIGVCPTDRLRRNSGAQPGDVLILTKGIGVGIYSAAFKKGDLDEAGYGEMIATTTLLNSVGTTLAENAAVHAITDVTGFGILGHGLEMARGSALHLKLQADAVPLLSQAAALAQGGFITGASHRNWASYGDEVTLPEGFPDWRRLLLADPQTSGGLLVAVAPDAAEAVLADIRQARYPAASIVGVAEAGTPEITIV
ncbi:selenide, water dikinase SelD [Oricola sp.]|uniref:selenide, water dikinase SelD n=1 Tax=Oricola sp. TaxID=1979950 RepID=UPI0025F13AB7|nr:selenide, water dikinase SelD [Oricola sp.]MCI5078601.1 selenide, water dikinase SelD [Oricola sp.]